MKNRLLFLKILHTVVWVIFVLMICYILLSGITGRIGWFTYFSVVSVALEGIVLLVFRWRCPITVIAGRYTENREAGYDIFLPRFVVKYNKAIFATLYVVGVVLVLLRQAL